MPEKYHISVLSGMEVPNLQRILREYGVPEKAFAGKRKIDLIEMVCDRQEPRQTRPAKDGGRVRIDNPEAFRNSGLRHGDSCDICYREVKTAVRVRDATFISEFRDLKGKVIGLTFRVNGLPKQVWWNDMVEAWKN